MMFQACQGFYKQFKISLKENAAFRYSVHLLCVFCFIEKAFEDAILHILY